MKILLVEDDEKLGKLLRLALMRHTHIVEWSQSGHDSTQKIHDNTYDAVILDVSLPDTDGFSLCRLWRQEDINTPVLFLTARNTVNDKVEGLYSGGDDYVTKPFALEEVLARLHSLTRRGELAIRPDSYQIGNLRIDLTTKSLFCGTRPMSLAPKEWAVLEILLRHHRQVVTREDLLDGAWPSEVDFKANVVDAVIARLRKQLHSCRGGPKLQTLRGQGFMLS
ncbi:response regulator transcription factor [Sulfobacillus thermosulfidooxidans]|uniref:response regulator transcription factor n=1 Tax=Sulfobacillus thermosulfidooxidans TaxID=28034 RepID=UPI0002EEC59C|nr:response regulator transcription factor [Sulfobacillus thermosulfidooxidans]